MPTYVYEADNKFLLCEKMARDAIDFLDRSDEESWPGFVKCESLRRLYFCAFIVMMTISEVYGTITPINLIDVSLQLPSSEAEWAAKSEEEWRELVDSESRIIRPDFRLAMSTILARSSSSSSPEGSSCNDANTPDTKVICCSSLGALTLILSVLAHTYHLSVIQRSENLRVSFAPEDSADGVHGHRDPTQTVFREQFHSSKRISEINTALTRWQRTWNSDPEAKMSPINPHGPLSFNATAHYRVTYLRMYRYDFPPLVHYFTARTCFPDFVNIELT